MNFPPFIEKTFFGLTWSFYKSSLIRVLFLIIPLLLIFPRIISNPNEIFLCLYLLITFFLFPYAWFLYKSIVNALFGERSKESAEEKSTTTTVVYGSPEFVLAYYASDVFFFFLKWYFRVVFFLFFTMFSALIAPFGLLYLYYSNTWGSWGKGAHKKLS